jgi:hypothetical protein
MSNNILNSINRNVIIQVINGLPEEFSTKDVSENIKVVKSNPGIANHSHYHAFIGKFLKNRLIDSNGKNMLIEIASKKSRGSIWRKNTL